MVGLTRPNGCFLSVPLGILALEHVLDRGRASGVGGWWQRLLHGQKISGHALALSGESPAPHDSSKRPIAAVLTAAMPGIGMLLYSLFIYDLTGDAFAWAKGHLAWGRQYGGLSNLFVNSYVYVSYFGLYAYTSSIPLDIMNAAPALFVFAMTWLVFRRFGLPYAVFLLINLVPPILVGGFLSVGRFTSVLFPAFLALALLVPLRIRPAWIAAFGMGQALNATLFFTWRELF
jgi:hypothetical protein